MRDTRCLCCGCNDCPSKDRIAALEARLARAERIEAAAKAPLEVAPMRLTHPETRLDDALCALRSALEEADQDGEAMSERVERLRELEAKASPAKWKYEYRGDAAFIVSGVGPDRLTVCEIGGCFVIDAELICALRNAAPAILRVVEAANEAAKPRPHDAMCAESHAALVALRAALRELEREGE